MTEQTRRKYADLSALLLEQPNRDGAALYKRAALAIDYLLRQCQELQQIHQLDQAETVSLRRQAEALRELVDGPD